MSTALDHLAMRVADDPFFLARPLAEFARSEGLDDGGLAAKLGCRMDDLAAIRLCRAPRPDPGEFRSDIEAVAARFGIEPPKLAAAVRLGQSLAHLRETKLSDGAPGVLLAARDDDRPPPEGGPPP